MNWFTSTPISFCGDENFFSRDSGLICRGLQSLGLECKCIMPLPEHADDISETLIRTHYSNLSRPEWWDSIQANNVVLYSWGHYKYREIAKAVHNAGAKVFVNLDSAGIISPTVTPQLYAYSIREKEIRKHGNTLGALTAVFRNAAYRLYIPLVQEPGRIEHLRAANVIGCISPYSLELWRLWAYTYAPDLIERMHVVPNPVADYLKYDESIMKKDSVIAIGRWDDEEPKRPSLLASTIAKVAKRRNKTEFHIYGNPGRILPTWHKNLENNMRQRIYLYGNVQHRDIQDNLIRSRVSLCSSSHEGSHVASEEALCCGASVVASFRPELNALLWYVSHDSGRLSVEDSAQGLAETLLLELEAWDKGERDPDEISKYWRSNLSVLAVVTKIRELME